MKLTTKHLTMLGVAAVVLILLSYLNELLFTYGVFLAGITIGAEVKRGDKK